MSSLPVTIIRHPKERVSKCSLQPLYGKPGFTFLKATSQFSFDATGYILLSIDAPVLSEKDVGLPLLLLDSTWRLLPQLEAKLTGKPIRRSLPTGIATAYPRISKISKDPLVGLASIEALYLSKLVLGEEDKSLLEGYFFKDLFLANVEQYKKGLTPGSKW